MCVRVRVCVCVCVCVCSAHTLPGHTVSHGSVRLQREELNHEIMEGMAQVG